MAELIGKILADRYRVDSFLGRGGMAEVYKVWDNHRMTFLAMKVLHQDLAVDRVFMRRFQREAQTLEKLQHPNIVRFYGLERDGRLAFMLLDYIEGENLKPKIFDAEGPYPLDGVRTVMRAICGALAYAHREGHIHCDIKPGNIMIDEHGKVLLSDFGIARMSDAATATMVGLGTPAYMAPEQARGLDPLPQTDIYALGIVLFEMLTGGERPFTGEQSKTTGSTSEKVRWEQINLPPPSPKRWNPDISDELEAVVLKCLAKDPAERYASPLDLLNALELALPVGESLDNAETLIAEPTPGGDSIKVTEVPDGQKEPQELPADEEKPRRRSLVPVLIGLGLAAIIVGVGMFLMGRGGTGPLSMLAAATDTPTVTASPLPTETLQDTPAPLPTATAVPASITPSATWTLTQTPSPTPTDTATSPPTDTPTVTQTLTPSPLPEGYALVPDVTGLDFYTAGLKLQEAGFEVEKEFEYNPTTKKNITISQDPLNDTPLPKSSIVKIIVASEVKIMLGDFVQNHDHRGYSSNQTLYAEIPENTWCEYLNSTGAKYSSDYVSSYLYTEIIDPVGNLIGKLSSNVGNGYRNSKEFFVEEGGLYAIKLRYFNVDANYQLNCKPPYSSNENSKDGIVPDVIGLRYDDASREIRNRKLTPLVVWILVNDFGESIDSSPKLGVVIDQDITSGNKVDLWASVEIRAVGTFQDSPQVNGFYKYFFELLAGKTYSVGVSPNCEPNRYQQYSYKILDSELNKMDGHSFYRGYGGYRESQDFKSFSPPYSGVFQVSISYDDDVECGFTLSVKSD